MRIKVLGPGCSKCHATIGIIERFVRDAAIEVEIVRVESPDEIKAYGVHATPAVVIADEDPELAVVAQAGGGDRRVGDALL